MKFDQTSTLILIEWYLMIPAHDGGSGEFDHHASALHALEQAQCIAGDDPRLAK